MACANPKATGFKIWRNELQNKINKTDSSNYLNSSSETESEFVLI